MSGVQRRVKTAHENEAFPFASAYPSWQIGLIHSVATVEEAAKLLRDLRWPNKGRVNLRARMACMEAFNGLGTCHEAWAAFVKAAREAGVLLEED
jgi:hypothetical protein